MSRASQRVPVSEVIWVIVLTKENLWEFIQKEAVLERPVEVFGELEMLQLLEQFFAQGLMAIEVPEAYGGSGVRYLREASSPVHT